MQLPSLKEITSKAENAFKRFPVTLIWAILGSFFIMHVIGLDSSQEFEKNLDIILTLVLGISWFIGAQFFIEQQTKANKWIWIKGLIVLLLFIFFWHLPDSKELDQNPIYLARFFLYLIAGHLFLLFAPFIKKWSKTAYWNYLKSVGVSITRSAIFSGFLYLGLALALLAIDALFDIRIKGERYGQLFIFCLGIVNTWIYLSDFPSKIHGQTQIYFDKALEVFVKFILIPLVILYIFILYAYGTKILIEWQLPKGWVSYLVTALALIGFLVQVIINPIQKTAQAWTIKRFYPWFYVVLLPLIVLLFVAIFRRINDYGITENRYFIVLIALWILGMALYLLLAKKRRLIVLPLSLFGLALLSSFGFWGVFSVSNRSQANQFKKVYEKAISNERLATYAEFNQLTSIIDYLDKREAISQLDAITGISMQAAMLDTVKSKWKSYNWVDTSTVMDSLGIKLDPADENNALNHGTNFSFYDNRNKSQTYDISKFSYFTPIYFGTYTEKSMKVGDLDLMYSRDDECLKLSKAKEVLLEIRLKEYLLKLAERGPNLNDLPEDEKSIELENDSLRTKIIFTELSFNIRKKDSVNLHNASAYILIKRIDHVEQD